MDNSSSIPKFSSFQPKKPPVAPAVESDTRREHVRREHKGEHEVERKSHRYRPRSSRHGRSDAKTSRQTPETAPALTELAHRRAAEPDDESVIYKSDRKGDPLILQYGGLGPYSVPTYFRNGRGSVIGVDPFQRIDRDVSSDKKIVLQSREAYDTPRRSLLSKASLDLSRAAKILIPHEEADRVLDHSADFVALTRKRKRGSESPELSSEEVDFRSIQGKAKPSSGPEDPDLQYTSESDAVYEYANYLDEEVKRKNSELARLCKNESQNLSAWVSFIGHQDKMIQLGRSVTTAELTPPEKQALADIKVSIYQEALKGLSENSHAREALWLGLLEQGVNIWEAKKLAAKWEEAVRQNPNSVKVWLGNLNHLQYSFSNFRYAKSDLGHDRLREIGKTQVYVFIRLTTFMRECGYHEYSVALWQAALEFVLLRPNLITEPEALQSFSEYWDDECPRLGEPKYQGWSLHAEAGEDQMPPDPNITELEQISGAGQLFQQFGLAEENMALKLAMPGHMADDAGEDDPFHVILFSDISPFLSTLLRDFPAKSALISGFLCFAELPPLPISSEYESLEWWQDSFLRNKISNLWAADVSNSESGSGTIPLASTIKFRQITTEVLFSDAFQSDPPLPLQIDWIEKTLQDLVQSNAGNDLLAEYFLAFTLQHRPSSAIKAAKRLIKSRSSCLRLYNACGIIEARAGRFDSANKVFSTALNMSRTFSLKDQEDTILLWRTWIWEHVRVDHLTDAVHLLLSVGDEQAPTMAQFEGRKAQFDSGLVLKARKHLSEGREYTISIGDYLHSVLYSELLALLSYFHGEHSLWAAMDSFQKAEQLFQSRGLTNLPYLEILHQAKVFLISYHTNQVKFFKPAEIRDLLAESIALFPNNTNFLTAYAVNESRFRLNDRVRSILSDVVLREQQDIVIGWAFAIWAEVQRRPELGGTVHGVRAVFEKAIEASGKHSIAIWTMYLCFEISRGGDHAKDVLFRGLAKIPCAKWYIILGFSKLAHMLSFDELESLYRLLDDKELRVHMNITELIAGKSGELTRSGNRPLRLT